MLLATNAFSKTFLLSLTNTEQLTRFHTHKLTTAQMKLSFSSQLLHYCERTWWKLGAPSRLSKLHQTVRHKSVLNLTPATVTHKRNNDATYLQWVRGAINTTKFSLLIYFCYIIKNPNDDYLLRNKGKVLHKWSW